MVPNPSRLALLALALSLPLAACSDDEPTGPAAYADSYELVSVDGEALPAGLSATLVLRANGTCTLTAESENFATESYEGTWALEGTSVSMEIRILDMSSVFTGSFSGDTLTLDDENGSRYVFER